MYKKSSSAVAAAAKRGHYPSRRKNPGSLAKFAAMRRASSRLSRLGELEP
jgi:hypothetical protein